MLKVQCQHKVHEVVRKATPPYPKIHYFVYNEVSVEMDVQCRRTTMHVKNVLIIVFNNVWIVE